MAPQATPDQVNISISVWNHSFWKRSFDLLLATLLLLLALPLMLLIGMAVFLTSPGPVLFRQTRLGQDGRNFRLLKFRTMFTGEGPRVTRAGDPRITPLGRRLRQWKLDELPQLWNVVCGDMSFVGPRPDVEEYLATLSGRERQVLQLRPGLTGVATLQHRDEEQILAQAIGEDIERFYCTEVLPRKARLDLDYAQKSGFISDVGILLKTATAIFR